MSSAVAALRAELGSARSILVPQIQGLKDFNAIKSLSEEARAILAREIGEHEGRRDRIDSVLAALDALEADGYPETPATLVAAAVLQELRFQFAAIGAAFAEFQAETEAVDAVVTAGEPENK